MDNRNFFLIYEDKFYGALISVAYYYLCLPALQGGKP